MFQKLKKKSNYSQNSILKSDDLNFIAWGIFSDRKILKLNIRITYTKFNIYFFLKSAKFIIQFIIECLQIVYNYIIICKSMT